MNGAMSASGPKQTWPIAPHMSAFGGKADMTFARIPLSRSLCGVKRTSLFATHMSANDPKRTCSGHAADILSRSADDQVAKTTTPQARLTTTNRGWTVRNQVFDVAFHCRPSADTSRPNKSHDRPMTIWQRIALNVGVALLAATTPLLPRLPAHAAPGCNIGDILQAAGNTAGAVVSSACTEAGQIGEGVGYGLAGGVAFGLGIVQANGGSVDNLCDELTNGQTDIGNLQQWLAAAGVSQDVISGIMALGGPALSVATCGCSLEKGVSQLANDVGDCACDLLSLVGAHCSCSPPPPVQANCALPTTCVLNSSDPACKGGIYAITGHEQDGPNGAFVSTTLGNDPNCGALLYCVCPKPLVPIWTDGSAPSNPSAGKVFGSGDGMFTCACPNGTHQAGTAGGIPICLCDYTNQPPKVADTLRGMCPINLLGSCKPNQIVVGGSCVTPCSDPTMGMTPDGTCCDPNQVTSCGQCCKLGTRPVNGSCVGPGPIQ